MLDFSQVAKELQNSVSHNKNFIAGLQSRLELTLEKFAEINENWELFTQKILNTFENSMWSIPKLNEKPFQKFKIKQNSEPYTVVAVDGSQIYPDRHEVSACYLINLGIVKLTYGDFPKAEMFSEAKLFAKENELYFTINGMKTSVNPAIVDLARDILEREKLVKECLAFTENIFGLVDGTLIPWTLGTEIPANFSNLEENTFKRGLLERYSKVYSSFYEAQIPFASYISSSKSRGVTNLVRLWLCNQPKIDCKNCSAKRQKENLTCDEINGITDSDLFGKLLEEGERTCVFESDSAVLEANFNGKFYFPKPIRIGFFYLKVQNEIARIELPLWLANDEEKLNFVACKIYNQVEKGLGFPISIAEAHNFAVVSFQERETFYRLLENLYTKEKISTKLSNKQLNKRIKVV